MLGVFTADPRRPITSVLHHSTTFLEDIAMEQDNRKAPVLDVLLSDGTQKQLSEFWQRSKLVLVFVRHFG